MPLARPFPIDKTFPNAVDLRQVQAGVFPREGLFPDPVTVAAAGVVYGDTGWNVGARAFTGITKRGGAAFTQAYGAAQVANNAAGVIGAIPAAPTSGSRIDLVWFRATDPGQGEVLTSETVGGQTVQRAIPVFGITPGTASTTPVRPALPAGAVELAQITTPSSAASIAASTIVPTYRFAHVVGEPVYVRNVAERDALFVTPQSGDRVYRLDTGAVQRYYTAAEAGTGLAGWIGGPFDVSLLNPFTDYSVGATAYMKVAGHVAAETGVATLFGLVRRTGNINASNLTFGTVPVGARPRGTSLHSCFTSNGTQRVDVLREGGLFMPTVNLNDQGYISLAGLSYSVLVPNGVGG